MEVSRDIFYVGVDDNKIDLFEGLYKTPKGMSYNSYVIRDEKVAVMDSVDAGFIREWMFNIETVLHGRVPDYLIVQHMEPDHSAGIGAFMERFPEAVLVASAKAFPMLRAFFGTEYEERRRIVKEGERLFLGKHTLVFYMAPLVHWPEVMVTFEESSGTLFSADAFGKFGTRDKEEDWAHEARRYYFGIVGKFGTPVQALLAKAEKLDIRRICPLHGPVLEENLSYYLELYHKWSNYEPETKGVLVAYASVYGNTKKAVRYLAECLEAEGCPKVILADLCRAEMSEVIEAAFRYPITVFASVTYNGTMFPPMRELLANLKERNFSNRSVAIIENGAWTPAAGRAMLRVLENCKSIRYSSPVLTLSGALTRENKESLSMLAKKLKEELS